MQIVALMRVTAFGVRWHLHHWQNKSFYRRLSAVTYRDKILGPNSILQDDNSHPQRTRVNTDYVNVTNTNTLANPQQGVVEEWDVIPQPHVARCESVVAAYGSYTQIPSMADKFGTFSSALPKCIGHPINAWSLQMARYWTGKLNERYSDNRDMINQAKSSKLLFFPQLFFLISLKSSIYAPPPPEHASSQGFRISPWHHSWCQKTGINIAISLQYAVLPLDGTKSYILGLKFRY